MKVELIYRDFLTAVKEIMRSNNRVIQETHSLILNLEKNTKDAIAQCKENLSIYKYDSDNLQRFIEKFNAANEK